MSFNKDEIEKNLFKQDSVEKNEPAMFDKQAIEKEIVPAELILNDKEDVLKIDILKAGLRKENSFLNKLNIVIYSIAVLSAIGLIITYPVKCYMLFLNPICDFFFLSLYCALFFLLSRSLFRTLNNFYYFFNIEKVKTYINENQDKEFKTEYRKKLINYIKNADDNSSVLCEKIEKIGYVNNDLKDIIEKTFYKDRDELSARILKNYTKKVMLATFMSPWPALDMMIVFYYCINFIEDSLAIFMCAPSKIKVFSIYLKAIKNSFLAAGMEIASAAIVEQLQNSLNKTVLNFASMSTQALGNGIFFIKFGNNVIDQLRIYKLDSKTSLKEVMTEICSEIFSARK